jgi:hypothetical protein
VTPQMYTFPTPVQAAPRTTDDRLEAVDDRLATVEELIELLLVRTHGVLTEIQAVGLKVDAVITANRAATVERGQ